jgi:OmpA-OmpF porin, OOP family
MSELNNWRIGSVLVLIIWALANITMTGRIEIDLAARAMAAVRAAGNLVSDPVVMALGRDVTLAGVAFTEQAERDVVDAANQTAGVRFVNNRIKPVPTAIPYAFGARRDGNRLVLTGYVPLPTTRVAIVEAAKAAVPGAEIVDRMAYARGAPEDFAVIAIYGLEQAGKLGGGDVSLSGAAYSIAGVAPNTAVYDQAIAATRQLPGHATLFKVGIEPPVTKPYVWSATSDGKTISLTGSVPSAEVRDSMVVKAASTFGDAAVENHLRIASGAPPSDFVAATFFVLEELAKLTSGTATFTDGHLSIGGIGKDGITAETMGAAIKAGLPESFDLATNGVVFPAASHRFSFALHKNPGGLTLTGFAPSPADRDAVLAVARAATGSEPTADDLKIGSGPPPGVDFRAAAALAFAALGRLLSGDVSLTDATLSVTGQTADAKAAAAARAVLHGELPAGIKLGVIDIRKTSVPPYVFNAKKRNGVLTLTGYVQDDTAHEEILAAVRRQFFDATLVDKLGYRTGAPPDFVAAVDGMLEQLSRLASGTGAVSDAKVSLKGDALYAKAATEIPAALAGGVPKGYAAVAALGVERSAARVEAAACQPLLASILDRGSILFDLGEATIQTDSAAALDHLVAIAMRCPDAHIEVSGPTDPVSDAQANIELSQRRAEAVANYLVEAGIDSGRLKAVGYGKLRPIASNDIAPSGAQSLRIEFRVK